MTEDWKQAIVVELLDNEDCKVMFRADVPLEVVEQDGEQVVVLAGAQFEVDGLTMVVTVKNSNNAGRAMTRRALPPDEVLNGPPDA